MGDLFLLLPHPGDPPGSVSAPVSHRNQVSRCGPASQAPVIMQLRIQRVVSSFSFYKLWFRPPREDLKGGKCLLVRDTGSEISPSRSM